MKKYILALCIVGAFVVYSFLYHQASPVALPNATAAASSSNRSSATTVATSGGGSDTSGGTSGSSSGGKSNGTYKDGSYTGSVADAQWGNIQVKAIIQGGKLTDVQFLQAPNDRNRSVHINQDADPQLASEAIQAQSAQVDVVSGATDSSEAFIQSLSDALAQAKA